MYIDKGAYKKANLLASYGLTKNMCDTAEKGIISHYSGIVMNSGIECNEIAMVCELIVNCNKIMTFFIFRKWKINLGVFGW